MLSLSTKRKCTVSLISTECVQRGQSTCECMLCACVPIYLEQQMPVSELDFRYDCICTILYICVHSAFTTHIYKSPSYFCVGIRYYAEFQFNSSASIPVCFENTFATTQENN